MPRLFFNILLFASPLSALRLVFRDRSCELLPLAPCFMGLRRVFSSRFLDPRLCSACWTYIGLRNDSKPIWVPNALGVMLSSFQMRLVSRSSFNIYIQSWGHTSWLGS